MYKDIVINYGSEFENYTAVKLVENDFEAYRIVYRTPWDLTGCSVKAVCRRADGTVISSLGYTEDNCAMFVIDNSMYAVAGELNIRLTVYTASEQVITVCDVTATAVEAFGDGIPGTNTKTVLDQILINVSKLSTELEEHKASEVIDHPDGSVTASKLGEDVRKYILDTGLPEIHLKCSAAVSNLNKNVLIYDELGNEMEISCENLKNASQSIYRIVFKPSENEGTVNYQDYCGMLYQIKGTACVSGMYNFRVIQYLWLSDTKQYSRTVSCSVNEGRELLSAGEWEEFVPENSLQRGKAKGYAPLDKNTLLDMKYIGEKAITGEKIADGTVGSDKLESDLVNEIESKADKADFDGYTAENDENIEKLRGDIDDNMDYTNNTFSNALKKRATGESILCIGDTSNAEHELEVKVIGKDGDDVSGASLVCSGGNLINVPKNLKFKSTKPISCVTLLGGMTYNIAFDAVEHDNTGNWDGLVLVLNDDSNSRTYMTEPGRIYTITPKANCTTANIFSSGWSATSGITATITGLRLYAPCGKALEYEEYKEPVTCSVGADGTVSGAKSFSPNLTLTAVGLQNPTIECTYNCDINEAFNIYDSLRFLLDSPEFHKTIFRGKYLGDTVTDEQIAAVRNGSFRDLFIGDYWTINGVSWRIVDMDYWYNTGTEAFTKHHLVIMPDKILYSGMMNNEYTTDGGYIGSKMYTENLEQAKTTIISAFGNIVLTHKEYLSNAVENGVVTSVVNTDSYVELPSEIMMYGTNIFSPTNNGTNVFDGSTFCKSQLALFAIAPGFITIRTYYWLRDVVSDDSFAGVANSGRAYWSGAKFEGGVRPVFSIG